MTNVPIVIISYNNYKYVKNMINQIEQILTVPKIIIIDNNSSCKYTINALNEYSQKYNVIRRNNNDGHNVWKSPEIYYHLLPDKFIITDPDLQFNVNTPSNFIDIMIQLSEQYNTHKVGFALDISEPEKMFSYLFSCIGPYEDIKICDSQQQYWTNRIDNAEYELYVAPIDTTFCLYNKNYPCTGFKNNIRIAGNFTMKHLPWYIDVEGISRYSRYIMYNNCDTSISSISRFELKYIQDNNFNLVQKRNENYLIQMDGCINDYFWINIYPDWKNDTFDIFDKYLDKTKQFLDIGAWVGVTSLYASRKSSYVVCVEADPVSVEKLKFHINTNYIDTVIDVEPTAIYSETTEILFGPNTTSSTSEFNDSMSQIKISQTKSNDILTKTITFNEIITKYNLNNLSLIKVDIEGGEEYILDEILEYAKLNNVPAYISFHYDWWNDNNLNRFRHLDDSHKHSIISDPFCSILFA
jgi:FkbM family methyltransferase